MNKFFNCLLGLGLIVNAQASDDVLESSFASSPSAYSPVPLRKVPNFFMDKGQLKTLISSSRRSSTRSSSDLYLPMIDQICQDVIEEGEAKKVFEERYMGMSPAGNESPKFQRTNSSPELRKKYKTKIPKSPTPDLQEIKKSFSQNAPLTGEILPNGKLSPLPYDPARKSPKKNSACNYMDVPAEDRSDSLSLTQPKNKRIGKKSSIEPKEAPGLYNRDSHSPKELPPMKVESRREKILNKLKKKKASKKG